MVPLAQLLHNQSPFQVLFTLHLNLHSLSSVRYQPCNHTTNNPNAGSGWEVWVGCHGESLPQHHGLGPPVVLSNWYLKGEDETRAQGQQLPVSRGQAASLIPPCSVCEGAKSSRY